ncbi:hypothetical protein A9Q99_06970 [Gammaproteobacteria bacterium 45_16_T64]|nr:hypothetical protein A9Q99_06970 [Gammaproteobacteria bacterium 45_16_T64]
MCGRLNVTTDPLVEWLRETLGISFSIESNTDLRPTETIATLATINGQPQQLNTQWGIKPSWSKKLIINAQGETAASKKTFASAFAHQRCLIPVTGWYEWSSNPETGKKDKYAFSHPEGKPLLMAGIWFANSAQTSNNLPQLVTLTTQPTAQCNEIHHRMPVIISPENTNHWLTDSATNVRPLMTADESIILSIKKQ